MTRITFDSLYAAGFTDLVSNEETPIYHWVVVRNPELGYIIHVNLSPRIDKIMITLERTHGKRHLYQGYATQELLQSIITLNHK